MVPHFLPLPRALLEANPNQQILQRAFKEGPDCGEFLQQDVGVDAGASHHEGIKDQIAQGQDKGRAYGVDRVDDQIARARVC